MEESDLLHRGGQKHHRRLRDDHHKGLANQNH